MRIITTIICISTIALTTQVHAAPAGEECTIAFQTEDDMKALIIREGFAFDGYPEFCEMLNDNGYELDITSLFGEEMKRSYGSIHIRFKMASSGVIGPIGMTGTVIGMKTGKAENEATAMQALNVVLQDMAKDPEPFILSVRNEDERLRTYYRSATTR